MSFFRWSLGRWMLPDQWMIMVAPSTDGQNNPRPDLFGRFLDNEAKTSGAEQVCDVGIIQPLALDNLKLAPVGYFATKMGSTGNAFT